MCQSRVFLWRGLVVLCMVAGLAGCATVSDTVTVESANQDSRVNILVMHYTSEPFGGSLRILTEPSSRPVSSHYLVPEPLDPSYPQEDLKIYALVPEEKRAWHAGNSEWKGQSKLNNASIGIEIVNDSYCYRAPDVEPEGIADWPSETICFYPDYPENQIELVIELARDILARYPNIEPTHVVGHSDIAPQRKIDPGPRFPWQRLYRLGIGAWYDDEDVTQYWQQFRAGLPGVLQIQQALQAYGYAIELTGEYDEQTRNVLRAFQLHFVPWQVTSEITLETAAILYAMVDKYYPDELEDLLPVIPDGEPAPVLPPED